MHPSHTVSTLLTALQTNGLPANEARMLLLHAMGRPVHERSWLLQHDSDAVDTTSSQQALDWAARRLAGEPIAYIVGYKAFYGLMLAVDARVLDPRPDTEILVDWALEIGSAGGLGHSVVDLGTGSGAIALALQHQRPHWLVAGVDASPDALAVAQANAERLQLPVHFSLGNWLDAARLPLDTWDMIVSNPPYIRDDDPHLEALQHEPRQALTSGPDGLDDIRAIASQSLSCLHPGGWLLLEHGHDQAAAVRAVLTALGYQQVQSRHDLAGIERCSGGQWAGNGLTTAPGCLSNEKQQLDT